MEVQFYCKSVNQPTHEISSATPLSGYTSVEVGKKQKIRMSQKFCNILVKWSTIRQLRLLLLMSSKRRTALECEMLSSPNTLRYLLAPVALSTASESTILDLPGLARSPRLLELEWNFLNYLITLPQMNIVSSTALWPGSNSAWSCSVTWYPRRRLRRSKILENFLFDFFIQWRISFRGFFF